MMFDKEIEEASALVGEPTGRRYKVRLIEGNKLGSTGYYPEEVLRRDGPKIFVKGTPMYLDHMLPNEKQHRPHGSVINYAAELAEDAYYEGDGLYADIEVFEHQIPMIKSLKDKIGISIRARGKCVDEVINGQKVPVFVELNKARSADFVVRAGAGGKIVEALEQSTEDSESASEEQEGRENMDEVLEAIKSLKGDVEARFKVIEEQLKEKPAESEEAKKTEVDDAKVLEIAEALAASSLSAEGRARVLDLHRANGKPLSELIEAEESYVKKTASAEAQEAAETEAEESAKNDKEKQFTLPSRWAVKKDN